MVPRTLTFHPISLHPLHVKVVIGLSLYLFVFQKSVIANDAGKAIDENAASLKCDACMIVAKRFGKSFSEAEESLNSKPLKADDFIEAAENTCDEDWTGYGLKIKDGVPRLVGPIAEIEIDEDVKPEKVWEHRLQDFCDELLSEMPLEKELYNIWSNNPSDLDQQLCRSEGIYGACTLDDFGPWPGEDYDDYDDEYIHDEF